MNPIRKYIDDKKIDNNISIQNESIEILAAAGIITGVGTLIKIFIYIIDRIEIAITAKNRQKYIDNELTNKLREVTEDNKTIVYNYKDKYPNAFCNSNGEIYISYSLKRILKDDESLAVVLHEYGHYYNNHINKQVFLYSPIALFVLSFLILLMAQTPLVFVSIFFSDILLLPISRIQEYAADSYAGKKGYSKELVSALYKLTKKSTKIYCHEHYKDRDDVQKCILSFKDQHKKEQDLIHPPDEKRKRRLEKILGIKIEQTIKYFKQPYNSKSLVFFSNLKNRLEKIVKRNS